MSRIAEVDKYLADLGDWRGEQLRRYREIIHEVHPEAKEEWKWDVPVFYGKKMVIAISAFKEHAKINFFQGAKLADPDHLFNNGLESKSHRSIDTFEGQAVDESALRKLIQSAFDLDQAK